MKTFLKVTIFSLAVIIFYAFYAGSMIQQFIQMGDEIFHGKGTCELCHNPVGGRAPLLDQAGKVAEERLKDSRYKGKAKTGEEYIREPMVEPGAFVVAGFGVKGTNDTQS